MPKGIYPHKSRDIAGQKFGRLKAIKFSHKKEEDYYWVFLCECKNEKIIIKHHVLGGLVKSCGCLQKEIARNYMHTITGDKKPNWKGTEVGYFGLHDWIRRQLGKPSECKHCGTMKAKRYDWANKSHNYLRDLTDWIRLCRSCHIKYDKIFKLENR